MKKFFYKLLNS